MDLYSLPIVGHPKKMQTFSDFIIEPTCASCTVGSYASLSVFLSVLCLYSGLDRKWEKIIHISKSIIAINMKLGHYMPHPTKILSSQQFHFS